MDPARTSLRLLMAELAAAKRAMSAGDVEQARRAVAAALAIDPGNVQALEWRAELERGGVPGPRPAPAAGTSASAPPGAPAAGWMAFEGRVRERRTRRLLDASRAALAGSDVAGAREAVEELTRLVPGHPELPGLREQLTRAQLARPAPPAAPPGVAARIAAPPVPELRPSTPVPPPVAARTTTDDLAEHRYRDEPIVRSPQSVRRSPEPSRSSPEVVIPVPPRRRGARVAVAAAAVLTVATLGALLSREPPPLVTREEIAAEMTPLQPAPLPEPFTEEELARPADPAPVAGDVTTDSPSVPAAATQESAQESREAPRDAPPEPVMTGGTEAVAPPVAPAPRTENRITTREASAAPPPRPSPAIVQDTPRAAVSVPASETAAAGIPDALPSVVERTDTPAAPPVSTTRPALSARVDPPPAAPDVGTAAAFTPARPDPAAAAEESVRQVLQRYVAAYNRLDASAARAVWPAVDRGALERAFSQLSAQTLRFDRCRVSVDGNDGSAECSGQAQWVPRVGDRDGRRESRTWRFDLTRNGDDWIITRAEARR